MHQDNLRQYASGHSLAFDWEAALLAKYSAYSTLPLTTLRWDDLGRYVKDHTSAMKGQVSGTWNRATRTATITSGTGGVAFMTGVPGTSSSQYAGLTIGRWELAAGQSVLVQVP